MKLIYMCLAAVCCVALKASRILSDELPKDTPLEAPSRKDVSEEMQLINKSLESLMDELAAIKREATGRLSQVRKNGAALGQNDFERIRQQKVSRFVLKRVAELESESLGMRDEMAKLFELSKRATKDANLEARQEDHDFDEPAPASITSTSSKPVTQSGLSSSEPAPASTTLKPDEEAAQIGFDLEQLKRLGEEIGKRLDQFGKEAAKNLGELVEGIKLVFREPAKNSTTKTASKPATVELKLAEVSSWSSQTDRDLRME